MKKEIFVLIAVIILVSGCSIYHLHSEDISEEIYASKKISDVVYLENVDKPHDVIGRVTVNAERRQKFDEILLKIKREAAIMGGDAITDIKTDSTGVWKKIPPKHFLRNGYIRANYNASVVVFK